MSSTFTNCSISMEIFLWACRYKDGEHAPILSGKPMVGNKISLSCELHISRYPCHHLMGIMEKNK